jgi:prophage regulatory protein
MRESTYPNDHAKHWRDTQAAERAVTVLAGEGLLRLPEVLSVFPVSKSTWWAGVREERYPSPVKLGPRCTAWRAADIRALIAKVGQ